mgnify:CR=1 FL=1
MESNDLKPSGTPANKPEPIKAANPTVPLHGVPGFHTTEEKEDHVRLAHLELDADEKGRVNTGTGDQPSNTGGSRFATPSGDAE